VTTSSRLHSLVNSTDVARPPLPCSARATREVRPHPAPPLLLNALCLRPPPFPPCAAIAAHIHSSRSLASTHAVFQYNLFQFLIANLDGTHLSQLVDAAGLAEGSNLELLGAVERTLTNQLLIIPALYYPIFFLITGIAYGLTLQEMKDRAGQLFLPLLRRNVAFWVPVQFVQFAFVQPELQLPFVCVAGLMWNIILSYVSLQADATEDEETDAASETAEQQQQQAQAQAQAQAQEQVGRVVPTTQAEPARNAYEGKESEQSTSSK
jgi:hypothetical protein